MFIEYILIFIIHILGASLDALSKVTRVRKKCPDAGFKMVWATYLKEEWNTLLVMAICLIAVLLFWFIAHYRNIPLAPWLHDWGYFVIQLPAGYALHRLIYKGLGTFEAVIEKKINQQNP